MFLSLGISHVFFALLALTGCGDGANEQSTPERCDDAVDNDGDGLVDCADDACGLQAACASPEVCYDRTDQDLDGLIDCADADCQGADACLEGLACSDGVDQDLNGLIDCADSACLNEPGCREDLACADGADNDRDGLVDCEDDQCSPDPRCTELECDDGLDGDADGAIDCLDPDCWGWACPADIRAVAGAARYERINERIATYNGSDVRVFTDVWTIEGVRGEIRSAALGAPCEFGVDRVEIRSQVRSDSYSLGDVTRTGFVLDPGCPLSVRAENLPAMLPANRTQAPTTGQPVYAFGPWNNTGLGSTAALLP
jgi:hypothetical protein